MTAADIDHREPVVDLDAERRLWQYRIERRLAALELRVEQVEADLWCWRRQTRRRRWFGGGR